MLFGTQPSGIRRIQKRQPFIFLPMLIAFLIAISACTPTKGSMVIHDNPNGTGFTMVFEKWSSKDKYDLSLNRGDVLQFEVARDDGEVALMVSGKNGSEPYTGSDLVSGIFTVTVSETDEYSIRITGKNATGKVTVNNVESRDK